MKILELLIVLCFLSALSSTVTADSFLMKTYANTGYLDSHNPDDRVQASDVGSILSASGLSDGRKITSVETPLAFSGTITDSVSGATYTENESYFASATTAYDDNIVGVDAQNVQLGYEVQFTNPIQFCTNAIPSTVNTVAGCDDAHLTQKHNLKIKFLGNDWDIVGLNFGANNGLGTPGVDSITLIKHSGTDKIVITDSSPLQFNGDSSSNAGWNARIITGGTGYGPSVSRIQLIKTSFTNFLQANQSVTWINNPANTQLTFQGLEQTQFDSLTLQSYGYLPLPVQNSAANNETGAKTKPTVIGIQSANANAFTLTPPGGSQVVATSGTVYWVTGYSFTGASQGAAVKGEILYGVPSTSYFAPYIDPNALVNATLPAGVPITGNNLVNVYVKFPLFSTCAYANNGSFVTLSGISNSITSFSANAGALTAASENSGLRGYLTSLTPQTGSAPTGSLNINAVQAGISAFNLNTSLNSATFTLTGNSNSLTSCDTNPQLFFSFAAKGWLSNATVNYVYNNTVPYQYSTSKRNIYFNTGGVSNTTDASATNGYAIYVSEFRSDVVDSTNLAAILVDVGYGDTGTQPDFFASNADASTVSSYLSRFYEGNLTAITDFSGDEFSGFTTVTNGKSGYVTARGSIIQPYTATLQINYAKTLAHGLYLISSSNQSGGNPGTTTTLPTSTTVPNPTSTTLPPSGNIVKSGASIKLGSSFQTLFNLRPFVQLDDTSYLKITSQGKVIDFQRFNGNGFNSVNSLGSSVNLTFQDFTLQNYIGSLDSIALEPSPYARIDFEFGNSQGPLLKASPFLVVQGTGVMQVKVQPNQIGTNKNSKITVSVLKQDGTPITDSKVRLEDSSGNVFNGLASSFNTLGDGTQDNGKDGLYVFNNVMPTSPGIITARAQKAQYTDGTAAIQVSSSDFLSFDQDLSSTLQVDCSGRELRVANALNTKVDVLATFSSTPCISISGPSVSRQSDNVYGFSLKPGKDTVLLLGSSARSAGKCFLQFSSSLPSSGSEFLQQALVENTCQPTGLCNTNDDCPVSQLCQGGKCVSNSTGGTCNQNSDCINGLVCVSGVCVQNTTNTTNNTNTTCTSNANCLNGYSCVNRVCTPNTNGASLVQCNPALFDFSKILARRLGQYTANQIFNNQGPQSVAFSAASRIVYDFSGLHVAPNTLNSASGCTYTQNTIDCVKEINAVLPTNGMAFAIFNNNPASLATGLPIQAKTDFDSNCFKLVPAEASTPLDKLVTVLQNPFTITGLAPAEQYHSWKLLFIPGPTCVTYSFDNSKGLTITPAQGMDTATLTIVSPLGFNQPIKITLKIQAMTGDVANLASKYALLLSPLSQAVTRSKQPNEPFFIFNNEQGGVTHTFLNPNAQTTNQLSVLSQGLGLYNFTVPNNGLTIKFDSSPTNPGFSVTIPAKAVTPVAGLEQFDVSGNLYSSSSGITASSLRCSDKDYCTPEEADKALKEIQKDVDTLYAGTFAKVEQIYTGSVVDGSAQIMSRALDDSIADYLAQAAAYTQCRALGVDPLQKIRDQCTAQSTTPFDPSSASFGSIYGNAFLSTACDSQMLNYAFGTSAGYGNQNFWDLWKQRFMGQIAPQRAPFFYPNDYIINVKSKAFVNLPVKVAGSSGGVKILSLQYHQPDFSKCMQNYYNYQTPYSQQYNPLYQSPFYPQGQYGQNPFGSPYNQPYNPYQQPGLNQPFGQSYFNNQQYPFVPPYYNCETPKSTDATWVNLEPSSAVTSYTALKDVREFINAMTQPMKDATGIIADCLKGNNCFDTRNSKLSYPYLNNGNVVFDQNKPNLFTLNKYAVGAKTTDNSAQLTDLEVSANKEISDLFNNYRIGKITDISPLNISVKTEQGISISRGNAQAITVTNKDQGIENIPGLTDVPTFTFPSTDQNIANAIGLNFVIRIWNNEVIAVSTGDYKKTPLPEILKFLADESFDPTKSDRWSDFGPSCKFSVSTDAKLLVAYGCLTSEKPPNFQKTTANAANTCSITLSLSGNTVRVMVTYSLTPEVKASAKNMVIDCDNAYGDSKKVPISGNIGTASYVCDYTGLYPDYFDISAYTDDNKVYCENPTPVIPTSTSPAPVQQPGNPAVSITQISAQNTLVGLSKIFAAKSDQDCFDPNVKFKTPEGVSRDNYRDASFKGFCVEFGLTDSMLKSNPSIIGFVHKVGLNYGLNCLAPAPKLVNLMDLTFNKAKDTVTLEHVYDKVSSQAIYSGTASGAGFTFTPGLYRMYVSYDYATPKTPLTKTTTYNKMTGKTDTSYQITRSHLTEELEIPTCPQPPRYQFRMYLMGSFSPLGTFSPLGNYVTNFDLQTKGNISNYLCVASTSSFIPQANADGSFKNNVRLNENANGFDIGANWICADSLIPSTPT